MTDVVEIARSRRARLAAEIARLDDFIHMAELLRRYGDDPSHGTGGEADEAGLILPLADSEADGDGSPQQTAAPAGEAAKAADPTTGPTTGLDGPEASKEAANAAPDDADAPNGKSGQSGATPERLDPARHSPAQNDEPVLTGQPSAEAQRVDAIIGLKLRQRRWMLGMTKKQLADKLGLGIEEIQKYERGAANIGTGRMWHLAAALEVPMSYFFETSDERMRDAGEAHAASPTERDAPPPAPEVALARTA